MGLGGITTMIDFYNLSEYKENEDIFVHYSVIQKDGYKTLSEGDIVNFRLIKCIKSTCL